MKDDFDIEFDKSKYDHYKDIDNTVSQQSPPEENPTPEVTKVTEKAAPKASESIVEYEDVYSGAPTAEENEEEDPFCIQFATDAYDNAPDETYQPEAPQDGKGKKKKKKIIIAVIIAAAVLIIGAVAATFATGNSILNKIGHDDKAGTNAYVDENSLVKVPDVMNILLIGQDDLEDADTDYSRSDTMIMATLDNVNKKIKLTSFMRDNYIYIPEVGYSRLNKANQVGGAQLLMDTLEYNFGVNIDAYAMVTFETFVDVIDKLGGVEVDVTAKEAQYIQKTAPHIKAGEDIHMNGDEALLYARIRKVDSDFNRTARQRKIIQALIEKAKNTSITTLLSTASGLAPDITTSLDKKMIRSVVLNAATYMSYDVEELRIPVDGGFSEEKRTVDGYANSDVLIPDLTKNKQALTKFLYPQNEKESTSGSENTTNEVSSSTTAKNKQ